MNPREVNSSGENNYLYYVITDNEGKVRGNVIGAQHWVEEKDTKLNPLILKAIDRSARIILEQPPGSDLLPKERHYFNDNLGYIIENFNLIIESKSSESPPETAKVQHRLKYIKEQIVEIKNGYENVENITKSLPTQRAKLKFLHEVEKTISQSWFEIKHVSFEDSINRIIHEKGNKKIEPLEDFNLMEKIKEAKQRMQPRLKKEAKLERHLEYLKEKRDHVRKGKAGRAKKASLTTQIQFYEERFLKKTSLSKIEEQAHKAELHQAWVKGEEKKLSALVDKSFKIYKEPPEIDEVHRSRDKDMADKIIEVVRQAKEEDIEATIMMGTAHLVYTVRTNVIEHLTNSFKKDLTGWSIKQVKINEAEAAF